MYQTENQMSLMYLRFWRGKISIADIGSSLFYTPYKHSYHQTLDLSAITEICKDNPRPLLVS